ncbi:MAG: SDR family NAD(P)-dependent oxidoreductase [Thermodesulfobacteriota bacterium]
MSKLKSKVAIITGGTGALGRGVVKRFLEEEANVLTTYVVERECEECQKLLDQYKDRIIYHRTDVTDEKDVLNAVSTAIDSFGKVDFLLNIVGGFLFKELKDTTVEDFDKMIDMNLKSCFICSKSVLPEMLRNKSGRIVNIAAKPAIKGSAGMSVYGASKSGVARITEALAEEVKAFNINVNAVIPGTLDTPRNRQDMPESDFSKWVKPEKLAEVILNLCLDESKLISGAVIPALGKS